MEYRLLVVASSLEEGIKIADKKAKAFFGDVDFVLDEWDASEVNGRSEIVFTYLAILTVGNSVNDR